MIIEHAPDLVGATPRAMRPLEQHSRQRLKVAAVEKLHLTVEDRTLCELVTVDELDVYPDEAALRAWNDGPLEQCAQCAAALLTPTRPSAPADLSADHERTGHPGQGQPDQPIPGTQTLMERGERSIDDQVLVALRAPTLSGTPAVMNPKRIGHHIGLTAGTGWGPSAQAVTAALKRLAKAGLVQRAGRSRTCWTVTR